MACLRPGSPVESEGNAMLKRRLKEFLADESGATAIEYCLIAAAIALAIIGLVNALGINIAEKLSLLASQLK
jgi:pilus assembly protein Flp/PilA